MSVVRFNGQAGHVDIPQMATRWSETMVSEIGGYLIAPN